MYDPYVDLFKGSSVKNFGKKVAFGFWDFLWALVSGTFLFAFYFMDTFFTMLELLTFDTQYKFKRANAREQRLKNVYAGVKCAAYFVKDTYVNGIKNLWLLPKREHIEHGWFMSIFKGILKAFVGLLVKIPIAIYDFFYIILNS